jgi:hypothetical protein
VATQHGVPRWTIAHRGGGIATQRRARLRRVSGLGGGAREYSEPYEMAVQTRPRLRESDGLPQAALPHAAFHITRQLVRSWPPWLPGTPPCAPPSGGVGTRRRSSAPPCSRRTAVRRRRRSPGARTDAWQGQRRGRCALPSLQRRLAGSASAPLLGQVVPWRHIAPPPPRRHRER